MGRGFCSECPPWGPAEGGLASARQARVWCRPLGAGRQTPGGPLGLGRPPSGPGPHLNPFPTQARVGSPSEVGALPQQALPSWPALHPRVLGSMPGLALNPRDEGVRAPWPSLMHACRIHR